MKKALIVVVIILALLLALAVSCPDEESFYRYVAQESGQENGNLLDQAKDAVLDIQSRLSAEYEDHTLWATAEATRGQQRHTYLGILGMWIEL